MAEIEGGGGGHKKGGKAKPKKMSTKVDFTPMVDLGFLLITFFMLTTTMNKPQAMEINMPDKKPTPNPTKIGDEQALTLLLGGDNRVFYYKGLPQGEDGFSPKVEYTNFSANGLRKMLLSEARKLNPNVDSIAIFQQQLNDGKIDKEVFKSNRGRIRNNKKGVIVLIKPTEESNYKNLVDVLDEMAICNIGIYAIVDISEPEKEMIKAAIAAAPAN